MAEVRGHQGEIVLSVLDFHRMGPRDQTNVFGLGGMCLYSLGSGGLMYLCSFKTYISLKRH